MKTLIVYDNEGYLISQQQGQPSPREPIGVPFMLVEIPDNKRLTGVDVSVTPHVPIFEDNPLTETELLKEENMSLKLAVAELVEMQETAKLETQMALAELAESLLGGVE